MPAINRMSRQIASGGKTPSRTAVSHFLGDLDRQARLAVEGFHSSFWGGRYDLDAAACARWTSIMEEHRRAHG